MEQSWANSLTRRPPYIVVRPNIWPLHFFFFFFFRAWFQPQLPVPLNQHCSTTHVSNKLHPTPLCHLTHPNRHPRPTPKTANTPQPLQSVSPMDRQNLHSRAAHNALDVSQPTHYWSTRLGSRSRSRVYLTRSSPYPQVRVPSAAMDELNTTAGPSDSQRSACREKGPHFSGYEGGYGSTTISRPSPSPERRIPLQFGTGRRPFRVADRPTTAAAPMPVHEATTTSQAGGQLAGSEETSTTSALHATSPSPSSPPAPPPTYSDVNLGSHSPGSNEPGATLTLPDGFVPTSHPQGGVRWSDSRDKEMRSQFVEVLSALKEVIRKWFYHSVIDYRLTLWFEFSPTSQDCLTLTDTSKCELPRQEEEDGRRRAQARRVAEQEAEAGGCTKDASTIHVET